MAEYIERSGSRKLTIGAVVRENGGTTMVGISKRSGSRKLTIGVATMPYRKKLCLVVEDGNTLTKYATFNNEEAAYKFMDLFADFMNVDRIEWFGRDNDATD